MSGGHYDYISRKDIQKHANSEDAFGEMAGKMEIRARMPSLDTNYYSLDEEEIRAVLKLGGKEVGQYWLALREHFGRYATDTDEVPEDLQLWHDNIASLLKDIEWCHSGDIGYGTLAQKIHEYLEKTPVRMCNGCGEKLTLLDSYTLTQIENKETLHIPGRKVYCSEKCETADEL